MRFLFNPLLTGFYPDPSVCRKGDDFYMVTSTFEYFPGVPVFHSRDFVHWQQIGHCLERSSQLNLDGINASKGVYAPTIRYHEGLFYMITTVVKGAPYDRNVNFYVTAEDPAGLWSEPIIVKGALGIDPTIFFDNGKAYYLGNLHMDPKNDQDKRRYIWIQELDLPTGELLGSRHILLEDGAVHGAQSPEAPHLYYVDGYYYLLIAEGGTFYNHAVSVFRSKTLFGPYENNPRNPVLTHRGMERSSKINSVGHADLIELNDGEWWAVMLACRTDQDGCRNLGRETFAAPVIWEEGWPVFSPRTGNMEHSYPAPQLPEHRFTALPACDNFESSSLDLRWSCLRTPRRQLYSLTQRPGFLRLFPGPESICKLESPAFIGRRQQSMCFSARTVMEFIPKSDESAGLVMLFDHNNHIRAERQLVDKKQSIVLTKRYLGEDEIICTHEYQSEKIYLMLEVYHQQYSFHYALEPGQWSCLAENLDGSPLSKSAERGFTGVYVGVYATSGGAAEGTPVDFDWFEYTVTDVNI